MKPLEPTLHPPANDSPCDEYDWRQVCPRCEWCKRPIDEDRGCVDPDCLAGREVEPANTDTKDSIDGD